MAIWNVTSLTGTNVDNFARFTWELNNLTDGYLALAILGLIFAISYLVIQSQGKSIWTATPVSLLIISILATLMRIWIVNGKGMVTTTIVITLWVLTAIAAGIRTTVNE